MEIKPPRIFCELNENMLEKANRRIYIGKTTGTAAVAFNTNIYKLYCIICPYPSALNKVFVPFEIDLGVITFLNQEISDFVIQIPGNSYDFRLLVAKNNVSIKNVKWDNTDLTNTAQLIVTGTY